MTTNAQLAKRVDTLAQTVERLATVVGGNAKASAKPKASKSPKARKTSAKAAIAKLAHKAGRAAQQKRKKGSKAGVAAYKKAYDAVLVKNDQSARYAPRDAARAERAAQAA